MASLPGQPRAASSLEGRRVVVGISGSIAAYKAPTIIRQLRALGARVRTVPTQAALRFIGAPTLAAVSGHAITTGVFDDPEAVEHVELARTADLVLVAPASADLLARMRAGRADDLLTATILATTAPVVVAPAMHTAMWEHPATQDNVAVLRRRGVHVIEPASGALTSGDTGRGRLPDPEEIVSQALAALTLPTPELASAQTVACARGEVAAEGSVAGLAGEVTSALAGAHVVISAGGTREPLDPVRFLGNRSSGRQGAALAKEAVRRGARVSLVAAHMDADVLADCQHVPGMTVREVGTALEMQAAVREAGADADVIIMAAAVADYRPAQVSDTKLKKHPAPGDGEPSQPAAEGAATGVTQASASEILGEQGPGRRVLELVENPDILAGLVSEPPAPGRGTVIVGFAAETGDAAGSVLEHGAAKARRKGADLMAVNAVGAELGFGDVPNAVVLLDREGREVGRGRGSKAEVARVLLDAVEERLLKRLASSGA